MRVWLEATLAKLSRKSDTAAAIRYARSRWSALTRYVDDGQLEIDNNAAERALRVVALGRKNFLFAGSDSGGERAAAIYSLLGSAKLNRLDPEIYLQHLLERIADHPSVGVATFGLGFCTALILLRTLRQAAGPSWRHSPPSPGLRGPSSAPRYAERTRRVRAGPRHQASRKSAVGSS